jgi:hypothetical protein
MGNASGQVKSQVDVTTDSYNDEGFAEVIECFGLPFVGFRMLVAARIRAKVALRIELADRWVWFGSQVTGLPGSEKVGCSRSDDRRCRNFWRLRGYLWI